MKSLNLKLSTQVLWLMLLFFLSGFAALIYQIIWHRALYQYFGVNIESVTIIVSIFMLGLGIGSLVGGTLSKRFPKHTMRMFIICELFTGLFGLVSIQLMNRVADLTVQNTLFQDALTIYALLAIPTTLMGATLPILCTHVFRHQKNVGSTVSILYFINTLGAAFACFFSVHVLFLFFGLKFSAVVAAVCNFIIVAVGIWLISAKNQPAPEAESAKTESAPMTAAFWGMLSLSAIAGFISMSQEIIWFRFFGYATGGNAEVFPYVLGVILFGIAFGSLIAKRICEASEFHLTTIVGTALVIAGVIFYFSLPASARLMMALGSKRLLGLAVLLLISAMLAAIYGLIFPVVNHYAVRSKTVIGRDVSYLYFANIVGATTGPLLTGFYLLQHYDLETCIALFGLLSVTLGWFVLSRGPGFKVSKALASLTVVMIAGVALHATVFENYLENAMRISEPFIRKLENRGGILAVVRDGDHPPVMYGDGGYEGRFNTDLVGDYNGLHRAFVGGVLHPTSRTLLEIGLATGSWTWAFSKIPDLESIEVVEINEGYLELIKDYPITATIFQDPRIKIHIDDGRRWLRKNPERKFDMIFMNSPFHYRSQVTNLLSKDFFELCKRHINEGGVLYVNATDSWDVPYTLAHVFKHVVKYGTFVAGSDRPFTLPEDARRASLLRFKENGVSIFEKDQAHKDVLERVVGHTDFEDLAPGLLAKPDLHNLITDDNLATEFKTNRRFSRVWWARRKGGAEERVSDSR